MKFFKIRIFLGKSGLFLGTPDYSWEIRIIFPDNLDYSWEIQIIFPGNQWGKSTN
jgi:hypothetical protein